MLLTLLGCVLFDRAAIDCARGEGCVDSAVDSQDTGETGDTQDTSDTQVPSLSLQVVVSVQGTDTWALHRWDDTLVDSVTGDGHVSGPVVWTGEFAVVASDGLLLRNGQVELSDVGAPVVALGLHRGQVIAGTDERLEGPGVAQAVTELQTLFPGTTDLWAVDRDGALDLVRVGIGTVHDDYDDEPLRAVSGFEGPQGVTVCSNAGGAWLVDDLVGGNTTSWRTTSGGLRDVIACGYDAPTDTLILVSATKGILYVDASGALEFGPVPEGGTVVGASFY
jgi:hypothetical protein